MRKRIYYTLIVFLIVIALMPWIEGALFKKHYLHLIDIINKDNRVKIHIIEYKQGWLHSRAKIFITPNKALIKLYQISISGANSTAPIGFTVDEQISHGPFIYDRFENKFELGYAKIQNNIYLPSQIETKLLGTLKTQGILQIDMLSEFDGDWSGKISIPAFSLSIPNFGDLAWLGLNGMFKIVLADNHFKHTRFEMQIGSIIMHGDAQNAYVKRMTIDPIKYRYNVTLDNSGLLSGYTNTYTRAFAITKADTSSVSGQHFAVHTAFNMDENTFYAGNLSINVKNLKISDKSLSLPTISPLHIEVLASNFDTKNLHTYVNTFRIDSLDNINNVDLKTLEGLLIHTITPTSIFRGEISLNSALGSFTCRFKSTLRPDIPAPSTFDDLIASANTEADFIMSPSVAVKIIELYNGRISVANTPKGRIAQIKPRTSSNTPPIASQTNTVTTSIQKQPVSVKTSPPLTPQQLIDELLIGGYLFKDDNNNYITNLTITSGVWQLNGKTVNSK